MIMVDPTVMTSVVAAEAVVVVDETCRAKLAELGPDGALGGAKRGRKGRNVETPLGRTPEERQPDWAERQASEVTYVHGPKATGWQGRARFGSRCGL